MKFRHVLLTALFASVLVVAQQRPAAAEGIRFSVWDTSYTTPSAGQISCRVEFQNDRGRYTLRNGQVGHLYNVRYDGASRNIDACWSFCGRKGVVRFDIRNNDTEMVGVWGYEPGRDVGLWNG